MKANHKKNQKRGQIAILLALSFSILALLAAMVINISFLVTAKINLQNATDMAAYAGAMQQARYLSEIGKWNYEMRRNYKAMAYDFVVAYNAEKKDEHLKQYLNNGVTNQQDNYPVICASLQRDPEHAYTGKQHELTCQNIPYDQFQTAIDQSIQSAAASYQAAQEACAANPGHPTCLRYMELAANSLTISEDISGSAYEYKDKYSNYQGGGNKYNYNLRLIAWTLHAYRHMQTRIRGVHYGKISTSIDDRFAIGKNIQEIDVNNFKNAPISVAAKVINGFTDAGSMEAGLLSPVMKLEGELLKNPVHNAASQSFKNNLLDLISNQASIFAIKPEDPGSLGSDSASLDMSGGCNSQCKEYQGPYLRLQQHDLSFELQYVTIEQGGTTLGGGLIKSAMALVNAFPVGVAKDARILTYYAVVGVADVADVPFNVFFGGGSTSEAPPMIAVAAARPFGSRIGAFIDETCNYSNFKNGQPACHTTGLDPLYPYAPGAYPNFSVVEADRDVAKLGVKITVDGTEHSKPQEGDMQPPPAGKNAGEQTVLFAKTKGPKARDRLYVKPNNPDNDDGHNGDPNDPDYYEKRQIPPQGNKNSIFAWPAKSGDLVAGFTANQNKKKSFEGYFEHFAGKAISAIGEDEARKINNEQNKIYVFKYPQYLGNDWDINSLSLNTGTNYMNNMEKSFARTMAVNEFEIKRYIIPYHTKANKQVLNYITTPANNIPFIHTGSKQRGSLLNGLAMRQGYGDKKIIPEYVKKEEKDVFDKVGVFPEYYTAWRTGIRGYRVKLTNIQDLLKSSGTKNPLPDTVNIEDEGISIDLKKVNY
jgi:hypothetical protein